MSAPVTETMKYDVFLSYSHEQSDLAERLSRRLRTYRPPRAAGLGDRRLTVFRDVERLTASDDLTEALRDELAQSRHLVVLASPAAAQSDYVAEEVSAFVEARGTDDVRIVLCEGELRESIPPSLAEEIDEPLYVDLRAGGRDGYRLATLRLIASVYGVDYTELRREDERRRRRRTVTAVAVTVLTLLLASVYLVVITPSEGWLQIEQPVDELGPNALAPVQEFAALHKHPWALAWYGENARYARDLATIERPWYATTGIPDVIDRALEGLAPGTASLVASLELSGHRPDDGASVAVDMEIWVVRGQEGSAEIFRDAQVRMPQMVTQHMTTAVVCEQALDLFPGPAETLDANG